MPAKDFPATSLGRSTGLVSPSPRPSRQGSYESLTAHPLLSPSPSTSSAQAQAHTPAAADGTPPPSQPQTQKYVPYTPRHRVPTTSVTATVTGTSVPSQQPAQHQHPAKSATSKLQLQNLRGHVESLGIDPRSLGWAILEKLVGEGDQLPEWNEIWNAITFGKASLLLPLEEATGQHTVTAEFIKDHIAFTHIGALQPDSPLVTLSGLRGSISENSLTLRSSIPQNTKIFQALLSPSTCASALNSLAPLPTTSTSPSYPQYSLPTHSNAVPLPPRASGLTKPILPPRPGSSAIAAPVPAPSRLHTFTSLFGRASSPVPSLSTSPAQPHPLNNRTDGKTEGEHATFEVSAFAIDRAISRKEVAKTIAKAIKVELKDALTAAGAPYWVAERLQKFISGKSGLHPFPKESRKSASMNAVAGKGSQLPSSGSGITPTDAMLREPDHLSQMIQEFYDAIEQDMRASHSPIVGRRRDQLSTDDSDEKEKGVFTAAEKERMKDGERRAGTDNNAKVRETLDIVERIISTLFYERLYRPMLSDDVSHDEALSSRIAALNMLDLNLEHLGVDVGLAGHSVHQVVARCGKTLARLDACRSPAEKAAVLVETHKVVVDSLSRLPPIRLKPDTEIDTEKTPMASTFPSTAAASDKSHPPLSHPSSAPLPTIPSVESSVVVSASSSVTSETPVSSESPTTDSSVVAPPPPGPEDNPPVPTVRAPPPPILEPPSKPTPVSADVILPILIFSVVKANPSQLVSHLLFTRRFRDSNVGGEESYCLITLMAVVEFLENVDLKALGLEDGESKVISTADLTPIPIDVVPEPAEQKMQARLFGRVEQQVDALTGSATRVISGVTGVVDSSFGVLRSMLPSTPSLGTPSGDSDSGAAPWNNSRPGFGLLRRESGFSIASIAASLPSVSGVGGVPGRKGGREQEEGGQQMLEVSSRPGSIRSFRSRKDEDEEEEQEESSEEESSDEDEEEEGGHEVPDTRSIRSFESLMSARERERGGRKSLSDRLANVSGLARPGKTSPSSSHGPSLPVPPSANRFDTPVSSRAASPTPVLPNRIAPPSKRFLRCNPEDLRLSEVGELLVEYRRLVDAVRAQGGFEE